jgi:hypothetical protein
MQLSQSLTNIGLAHQVLLSDGPLTCAESRRILPELCCVWSSQQLPESHFPFQLLLWNHRRAMAARSLRLGYNIMVLDTDMVVFDDPYKFLKQSPFDKINLMTMGETWPYETNSLLNLGFLYAQNARCDGPVAAILAEVPDRQLRLAEDPDNRLKAMWMVHQNCGTDEQLLFDDVVYGSVLKAPTHIVSMDVCGVPEAREKPWLNWTAVSKRRAFLAESGSIFTNSIEQTPPEWKGVVGDSTYMLKRANLSWWHQSGLSVLAINVSTSSSYLQSDQWPLEYGGQLLPSSRGPLSSAFQSLLANESACPLWPDPSSPTSLKQVRAQDAPVETFAIAPHFLVASFQARGILGLWGQHEERPRQVLGHIHQTPCDSWIGKRTIGQMLGHYNWTLSRQLRGNQLYFASSDLVPRPKVVVFAPCLKLGKFVTTLEDYKAILRGLIAVALLMDRAFVIPDLPCSLPFISKSQRRDHWTLPLNNWTLPLDNWTLPLDLHHGFMSRGSLKSNIKCSWQKFFMGGCMAGPVLSLAPWEFEEYSRQLGMVELNANNTVSFLQGVSSIACKGIKRKEGIKVHPSLLASAKPYVWTSGPEKLLSRFNRFRDEQIVFLRRPILVNWNETSTSPTLLQLYEERIKVCFTIKSSTDEPSNLVAKPLPI